LSKHILVVKSTNNFYAGFADIAAAVIHISTPGGNTHDVSTLPYKLADRNQWPLVDDPLAPD
jgi:microcystin degradation protein MlrC